MENWMDRKEALELLGVKPQTLYAYVSRKLIEMQPDPDQPRRSLYRADDVAGLAAKRSRSRRPSAIAAGSMAWGEPSISTSISTIHRGQLIFRGEDAVAFADRATVEQAAQLLWNWDSEVAFPIPEQCPGTPFEALAALAGAGDATIGRGIERLCRDAQKAVGHLAAACGLKPGFASLHLALADAWTLDVQASDLIRCALVLMADHELNPSTFAARVAAGTGAPIAASLLAGLCAFSGPAHGGAAAALNLLLANSEREGPKQAVRTWLDRFGHLPGFGHALYPKGDARALALVDRIPPDRALTALADAVEDVAGHPPNIDFALTLLARTLNLQSNAPFTIFLLGRSVGWAAHAMEQVQSGILIRPRAVYQGLMPD